MLDTAIALWAVPLAFLETFSRSSRAGRALSDATMIDLLKRMRAGAIPVGGFIILSSALSALILAVSSQPLASALLEARAIVIAICAASVALSLVSSAWFEDVHDAAGATYLTLFAAAASVVLASPLVLATSQATGMINAVLAVNPFVGVASATGFDLLRTDVLYRNLPYGQRLFEYPAWSSVAGIYLTAAACCLTGLFWLRSKETSCA